MTIGDFLFLVDANIDPDVIAFLRSRGNSVISVRDIGLGSVPDEVVLARATSEQRGVLTHDSDFGRLSISLRQPFVGIVFLRPGHASSAFSIESLTAAFDSGTELTVPFVMVVDRRGSHIRIRVHHPHQ